MALILVVDDDETICESLCELFAGESEGAATAEEAMAHLEAEEYAVVLTDISLPGMSGLELLSAVRDGHPLTPVIIISGINDKEYAEGLTRLGAFDYLVKPFKLEKVEESVNRAIEHHFQLVKEQQDQQEAAHPDKLKIYVVSIWAQNAKTGESGHEPGVVVASSLGEANQKGIELAHQKWPRGDGWMRHSVVAAEVDENVI
jgi:DNA-binding NtrC family response regulator